MAGSVAHRRNIKSKTGCTTCRIRKVKCDEDKPSCQRCVSTGRTCDGYQSLFRIYTSHHDDNTNAGGLALDVYPPAAPLTSIQITPRDIELLNHCFSTKTMFDVKLGCDKEAEQVLQMSLTDPSIRHAISSLKALREDLEMSGDEPSYTMQMTRRYHYGLEQYNSALGILASNLLFPDSKGVKSALLCCQIFISIEQLQKNYTAMAQHIIQGLRIIHEDRARPYLVARNNLVPAHHEQLPCLDVFIIKLFAAPCKFAEPPEGTQSPVSISSDCSRSQTSGACELRTLRPDLRTELTGIATSTVQLLGKVSQVKSVDNAVHLLCEKASLLESLRLWLSDLEYDQSTSNYNSPEAISVSFLRLFQIILKIVLLGILEFSPHLETELQNENARLQDMANKVGERLRTYTSCKGPASIRGALRARLYMVE